MKHLRRLRFTGEQMQEKQPTPTPTASPFLNHEAPRYVDGVKLTPAAERYYQHLKQDIVAGLLRPGDQVLTPNQLAAAHNIEANDVLNAYNLLVKQGFLFVKRGRGRFVAEVTQQARNRRGYNYHRAIASITAWIEAHPEATELPALTLTSTALGYNSWYAYRALVKQGVITKQGKRRWLITARMGGGK
jgi:DNA-binding transcriptional regulator YhcF (GntR family)